MIHIKNQTLFGTKEKNKGTRALTVQKHEMISFINQKTN